MSKRERGEEKEGEGESERMNTRQTDRQAERIRIKKDEKLAKVLNDL